MHHEQSAQLDLVAATDPGDSGLNYGWLGTIAQFLEASRSDWLEALNRNYQQLYRQRSSPTQRQAWADCGEILRSQFSRLLQRRPETGEWSLIFEYELPREGGRRPDLVILGAGQILVFEFKQKSAPSPADRDQVAAYARDLAEYHSASSQNPIAAILVPTRASPFQLDDRDGVQVLHPDAIADYLSQLEIGAPRIDPDRWVAAEYIPLPTIVAAARRIFQHEPLPDIRRARSAGIPKLIAELNRFVETAQTNGERHLVLVTGVPGAGKTLVGLQFVYQNHRSAAEARQAIFLSGNQPLITVLQYALKSRVFVQSIRNFYLDHESRRQTAPREHLIVFDEAQRAWDADRMAEKYGIDSAAGGAVLRIAERVPNWCVVLGLIGEGQEIHVGEEEGIGQWNTGLAQAEFDWHVHCAPDQARYFTDVAADRLHTDSGFDLTTSLRTHTAQDVQTWVAHVLSGNLAAAASLMPELIAAGYDAYLTRDLEAAKTYCRDRYANQPDKRYGLLASSRARNLPAYGIPNDYLTTQRLKIGPWYIDPVDSPLSCCALDSAVTEFSCQGLEVDWAIVGWGTDLVWRDLQWVTSTRQKQVRDPLRLRLNSYRVLLTRGRDGFIIFVPPDTKLDATFEVLRSTGLQELT